MYGLKGKILDVSLDTPKKYPQQIILEKATVTRVVDGDTIEANVNGKKEVIRMLLVDTPEMKHPNKDIEYFAKASSNFTKKRLPTGKEILLEKDISDKDKYGRLLRYIWLRIPQNLSKIELQNKCFNAMLLKEGYGTIEIIKPDVKYEKVFKELERESISNNEGVWNQRLKELYNLTLLTKKDDTAKPFIPNKNTRTINVDIVGPIGAKVTAIVKFKTKDSFYEGIIGENRKLIIPIKIGSPKKGFEVFVDVIIKYNGKEYTRRTSFIPT